MRKWLGNLRRELSFVFNTSLLRPEKLCNVFHRIDVEVLEKGE
jgi:hypothetical protein